MGAYQGCVFAKFDVYDGFLLIGHLGALSRE
jgi:hypothetical protein